MIFNIYLKINDFMEKIGLLKKMLGLVKKSVLDGNGKISHTRIMSYYIIGSILTSCGIFIVIDLGNAITKWLSHETYEIPFSHITLFGLILSHHLVLMGLKKSTDEVIYKNDSIQYGSKKKADGNTNSDSTSSDSTSL